MAATSTTVKEILAKAVRSAAWVTQASLLNRGRHGPNGPHSIYYLLADAAPMLLNATPHAARQRAMVELAECERGGISALLYAHSLMRSALKSPEAHKDDELMAWNRDLHATMQRLMTADETRLDLRRIDWLRSSGPTLDVFKTSAAAVHAVRTPSELRTRLNPMHGETADQGESTLNLRCFGLFHPYHPTPLAFVELAVAPAAASIGARLEPLLKAEYTPLRGDATVDVDAVFYAIVSVIPALNMGAALLKRVRALLLGRFGARLRRAVTLSPIPSLRRALPDAALATLASRAAAEADAATDAALVDAIRRHLLASDARATPRAEHADAVAMFHLGQGASLGDVHLDAGGKAESHGVMVNYVYHERQ